jgi:hypothetical protein
MVLELYELVRSFMKLLIFVLICHFASLATANDSVSLSSSIVVTKAVIEFIQADANYQLAHPNPHRPKGFVDTSTITKIRVGPTCAAKDPFCQKIPLSPNEQLVLVEFGFTNAPGCFAVPYIAQSKTDGLIEVRLFHVQGTLKCELTAAEFGIFDGNKSGFSVGN